MKPRQVVEPLYAASGLQAAVEPTPGEAVWWELPSLAAECCGILLHQFGPSQAESRNLVLLDQAPAHGAQRVSVPDHVVRMWLPAQRPELNPVERLWEDLKNRIAVVAMRVRRSRAAWQAHVAGLVQRYTAATIASLTGYASLVEAVGALPF